jgi:hypothetical protein
MIWWLSPSLGQSLWVDELHSAWVADGSWTELPRRAADGNQPPLWFAGLKLWRDSWQPPRPHEEWWWRMPSLLAWVLAAAGLSVLCQRGAHRSSAMGPALFGGLLLLSERNGLFFASEARSYATIVATTTWSAVGLSAWLFGDRRGGRWAWWLLAALSVHLHYTAALMVVGLWLWNAIIQWHRRQTLRDAALDALVIGLLTAPAIPAMWEVWQRRQNWTAIASLSEPQQILRLWPWMALLAPPLLVGGLRQAIGFERQRSIRWWRAAGPICWCASPLALAAMASISGLAPLWHRRFLLGTLPALLWGTQLLWQWAIPRNSDRRVWWAVTGVSVFLLLLLQGTISDRMTGDRIIARRGEDWRSAAQWIEQRQIVGDAVGVCAWLLEGHASAAGESTDVEIREDQDYLGLPLRSCYALPRVEGLANRTGQWRAFATARHRGFLVVRGSPEVAASLESQWLPAGMTAELQVFPGVLVWRFVGGPTLQ